MASIWRMRSRVTWKDWPTSSRGVLGAVFETETHLDDALFARGEGAKNLRGVLLQVDCDDGVGRADGHAVFDEVAEVRIFLFTDRSLKRDGFLRDLEDLADLRDRVISMRLAISSDEASRPSSCTS